ncbi:Putative_zinc finger in N-recognin (UBR box) domain-containing protein [Hexamita inflata]|uniref:Zinc finger in N-recognin (UBR box) domain-containing protein n=1 Tax=Hexamita inflata TaxID=28002 RepID=A0AA86QGB7_9EUKA|nr:Putative zinc finger in N-recognin (UBR box) domain-containing protein [Hexamita inflata]
MKDKIVFDIYNKINTDEICVDDYQFDQIGTKSHFDYCSQNLESDNLYFMCDTCANYNVIMCDKCLLNARVEHRGHNIRCVTNFTGLCDCGKVSAYSAQSFCCDHKFIESTNLPAGSSTVLKYYYDFVCNDYSVFERNIILALQLQCQLFQINTKEINDKMLEKCKNDPNIFRLCTLAFLFSGEQISFGQLFELQKDFNKLITYGFTCQPSLLQQYVKDAYKPDFYHNHLTSDFLFRVILPHAYEPFYALNESRAFSLGHSFVQSLCEPLTQVHFRKQKFIEVVQDRMKYAIETNSIALGDQFTLAAFQESPIFANSLLFHENSNQMMQKITELHWKSSQNIRYEPEREFENQQEFLNPINDFFSKYMTCANQFTFFLKFLDIKQDLNYEQLLDSKINDELKPECSYCNIYNTQQMSIEQFVSEQPQHTRNILAISQYYIEQDFFIKENVCVLPVFILQIYLARICEIFLLKQQNKKKKKNKKTNHPKKQNQNTNQKKQQTPHKNPQHTTNNTTQPHKQKPTQHTQPNTTKNKQTNKPNNQNTKKPKQNTKKKTPQQHPNKNTTTQKKQHTKPQTQTQTTQKTKHQPKKKKKQKHQKKKKNKNKKKKNNKKKNTPQKKTNQNPKNQKAYKHYHVYKSKCVMCRLQIMQQQICVFVQRISFVSRVLQNAYQ